MVTGHRLFYVHWCLTPFYEAAKSRRITKPPPTDQRPPTTVTPTTDHQSGTTDHRPLT